MSLKINYIHCVFYVLNADRLSVQFNVAFRDMNLLEKYINNHFASSSKKYLVHLGDYSYLCFVAPDDYDFKLKKY